MIFQLTGLSGAGKTTLATAVAQLLNEQGIPTEVIDGDVYRKTICKDLGFTKADRLENIKRLGTVANGFKIQGKVSIIAAINPYEEARVALQEKYNAKTVWIKCSLETLQQRDTKGLYKKALLPDHHPDKLQLLTGVSDVYEEPISPHLVIDTGNERLELSQQKLFGFIYQEISAWFFWLLTKTIAMLAIKLRYNTECTDNILLWRVLIDGNEQLASEVKANVPSRTTRDTLDDGRIKFHVTYYCNSYTWEGTVLVLN